MRGLMRFVAHCPALVAAALLMAGCGEDGDTDMVGGGNWSMFGHDLDNTRHAAHEDTLGRDNVASLQEQWRWPSEGEGPGVTGTPAVVDGVVYFSTWQGDVVALDTDDGSTVWHEENLTDVPIDSSPCVTRNRVFIATGGAHPAVPLPDDGGRGSVYALDRSTGEVLWTRRLEPEVDSIHLWGSPVYVAEDDLVLLGVASNEVVGLSDAYVFRGSVAALHADTGEIAWQVYLTGDDLIDGESFGTGVSVWSTPAVDTGRGMLFVGTGQNHTPPASPYSDSLVAIDYRAGELVWHRQYTEGDVFQMFIERGGPDYDVGAGPNLFTVGGRDVVGVADKGSTYATMDRDTGELLWTVEELTPGSALGGVMGTAAYHDGRLYVVSNDMEGREGFQGSSVVFALDAPTGDILWSKDLPSPVFGETTLANGVVYVGTTNGEVFALDTQNGDVLWTVDGLEDFGGGISVSEGRIFVPHGFEFVETPGLASGGLVSYGLP